MAASRAQRGALAAFVLLLVALAFARAEYASSTGIRVAGDGLDYEAMAGGMRLEGRAPFVYRPAVPFLVGMLFPGNLGLGFSLVCAAAMFAALLTAAVLARDTLAGCAVAAILLCNYQVLFAAANPARIDIVVLAVQLAFVAMAMARNQTLFFAVLPLCALLKESLLLSLAALALAAFPRRRATLVQGAYAAAGFVALHLTVRLLATPTAAVPPYTAGLPSPAAMLSMAASNLSPAMPLHFFVAWGGLSILVLALVFGLEGGAGAPLAATAVVLLLFPLPLATDAHRAWFELLAPAALFLLLRRLRRDAGPDARRALALALIAGIVPYATRLLEPDHLYLLILQGELSAPAVLVSLAASLVGAAMAWVYWRKGGATSSGGAGTRN